MIYRLDFDILNEFNNYESSNIKVLKSIHSILSDSLLLYRYEISKSIENRFGVKDPEKIDFDLIKNKSIVVCHLDIYKEKPLMINNLINFCLENNKDLFIPTQQNRYYIHDNINKHEYKFDIALELDAYDYQYFDMTDSDSFKQLKRELVINSLY